MPKQINLMVLNLPRVKFSLLKTGMTLAISISIIYFLPKKNLKKTLISVTKTTTRKRGEEMEREQKTIRLTVRPPDELEDIIRDEAKAIGISMNPLLLMVLNRWAKSLRTQSRKL